LSQETPDPDRSADRSADRPSRRIGLAVGILMPIVLVLLYLVYRPGLDGPFLLDDESNIPQTQVGELTLTALKGQLLDGEGPLGLSRGLVRLSFALTQFFDGPWAYAFKYQNLLIHLINGLLAFWLIWLLARHCAKGANPAAPLWLALGTAGLWALHPLHVSTVLYAVQRLVLLSSLFQLCALIAYVKGRLLAQTRPLAGAALALVGVGAFGALALMSKETAAALPLLLATVEGLFFGFRTQGHRQRFLLRTLWLALIAIPLVLGAVYLAPRLDALLGWQPGRGFSGVERLMTQAHAIALYLKLFFLPVPGAMSLYHDTFPITRHLDVATVALAGLYAGLVLAALLLARRAPWIGFGVLWFFACHTIESTVLPLEMVFEHRNYLATLGLAALTVFGLAALLERIGRVRLVIPALVALALLLAFNTASRASLWADLETMLAFDYSHRPDSPRVLEALLTLESARGNQAAALAILQRLLDLDIEDAAPEIVALGLYCGATAMPEALYARTRDKLATRLIAPTTMTTLATIANRTLQGGCGALAPRQLDELTRIAAESPRARGPDERCLAWELHTRVLIAARQWPQAQTALASALDQCATAKPAKLRLAIDNVLRFGSDYGVSGRTLAMLRSVAQGPARRAALDRAFVAQGGLDPVLAIAAARSQ
jgi:protein O-mannosyl-transferase